MGLAPCTFFVTVRPDKPEITHLPKAPIIEALVTFQANASRLWQPDIIRPLLAQRWPDHAEVQQVRPVKIEVTETPEGPLPPKVTFPTLEAILFRSEKLRSVHQAMRGGYAFSQLEPYQDWDNLQACALEGWAQYKEVLQPDELHGVVVRFINRVKFPMQGLKLSRYFSSPPKAPPDLNWQFHDFTHESIYAVPDSPCAVKVVIALAFEGSQDFLPFIIDIEVRLKESLPALGKSVEEVLTEMRELKNQAFFSTLTKEAIERYK